VRVEHIGRARQHAGLPPCVVVAEGDVRRIEVSDPDVAAGRAEVPRQADDGDVREPPGERLGGPVVRSVIDHDQSRRIGLRQRPLERPRDLLAPVVGEDDDAGAAGKRAHVSSRQ
jgi:hypothetical protein